MNFSGYTHKRHVFLLNGEEDWERKDESTKSDIRNLQGYVRVYVSLRKQLFMDTFISTAHKIQIFSRKALKEKN